MSELEKAARQALVTLEIAEGAFAFGHIGFVKMIKSSISDLRKTLKHPKRKWVSLTEKDIETFHLPPGGTTTVRDFAKIIEAKIKELNT